MEQAVFGNDSSKQMDEKLEKLKAFSESLAGKELQLKKKELELREKELQLKLYRKNLLVAIKEQLSNAYSHEESIKVLERYRDILQFIARDIKEDLDDIMG